jgi:phosphatidylglycerol:prolipoprotein diacylglycerol transferase
MGINRVNPDLIKVASVGNPVRNNEINVVYREVISLIPYLFKLGPLTIFPWGLTLSVAILLGTLVAIKLAKKVGFETDLILDLAIYLVIGGIVGARLFYVLVYDPAQYLQEPLQIFALWNGGMVYYGALIGGLITGTWFVIRKNLPFWILADVMAPPLALGYGIVRIGCFLNGCCYGKPTSSFIGVLFPYIEGGPSLDTVFRYPTQLFSSVFGFALFGVLLLIWRKKKFNGQVFLAFLILYAVERTVVEYYRENLLVFGPVTVSQLVSVLIFIPALYFYWRRSRLAAQQAPDNNIEGTGDLK